MVQKAEVEIKDKEKTPAEQAIDAVLKRIEKPVQPPPIEETLGKVTQAMDQAKKAKTPVKMTWYCTDCGASGCQNAASSDYSDQLPDHISVNVADGNFVGDDGKPLTGASLALMENYATPKASSGRQSGSNMQTLAKMRKLK